MNDARALLTKVDQLLRAHAPYEDLVAALDACDAAPGADTVRPGIVQRRLAIARLYSRSQDELVDIANVWIPTLGAIPPIAAAPTILAACAGVTALSHHLTSLKQALKAAQDRPQNMTESDQIDAVLAHVEAALVETRHDA